MGLYQKNEQTHWLVGWEWHAHMWYVTPPEKLEPQPETEWFFEYGEAMEYVDTQIVSAPVEHSLVDDVPQRVVWSGVKNDPAIPAYQPRTEPRRVVSDGERSHGNRYGVTNPIADQFDSPDRRGRLDDYAQSVGLR